MRSPRYIALTGVPRSGTTLCCHLLGQAANAIALFEPMEVHRLPVDDRRAALDAVEDFFELSRRSLLSERRAWSQQVDGAVPDNPIANRRDGSGRRQKEATRGEIRVDKPLDAGFTLVVKHNAAFAALLPELGLRFETWAVVRNPLAVLASWQSVDLPVSRGRLPAGERLDPVLAEALQATADVTARQLLILDWFFARFSASLPAGRVLAYEDVVATGGGLLGEALGVELEATRLEARNASPLYDPARARMLADRLLTRDGAWRRFYSEADVEGLARRLQEQAQ